MEPIILEGILRKPILNRYKPFTGLDVTTSDEGDSQLSMLPVESMIMRTSIAAILEGLSLTGGTENP